MATLVIGDSHARSFSLAVDKVYEYGGMSAHVVGQFGIPNTIQAMPGDHVLFCFGEVDVRVHLVKLAEQWGRGIIPAIREVTTRYVDRIRTFCIERHARGYIIAAPPPAVPRHPEAVVPVVDSISERVERARLVNENLLLLCSNDLNFIDAWGPWRMPDGSLNMDLSDDIVHIAGSQNELMRDLVLPHLTPPT